jgi:hypothetical protein
MEKATKALTKGITEDKATTIDREAARANTRAHARTHTHAQVRP